MSAARTGATKLSIHSPCYYKMYCAEADIHVQTNHYSSGDSCYCRGIFKHNFKLGCLGSYVKDIANKENFRFTVTEPGDTKEEVMTSAAGLHRGDALIILMIMGRVFQEERTVHTKALRCSMVWHI